MIRFDLKLLEQDENPSADSNAIAHSNEVAQFTCNHLKKLIGKRKCRKHPSSPNKIRMYAVLNGDPRAEIVSYCCPEFVKRIR